MTWLFEKLMSILGIWEPIVDPSEEHDRNNTFIADIGEGEGSGGDSGGDN